MKTLCKSFIALAAIAMVSTTAAQATTQVVHLSGSTAFRAAAYNAIARALTSPSATYIGSSLASANDAAIQGTLGGVTYQVECHWSGSLTGIVALTAPATNKYNFEKYVSGTSAPVTVGGQSNFYSPYGLLPSVGGGAPIASSGSPTGSNIDNANSDAGFSDAFQATATEVTPIAASTPALNDTLVGVLPFAFLKGSANTADVDYPAWQRLTDITANNAATLYAAGGLSFQLLDGNVADVGVTAIAVGRDEDSGTRVAAFAESGFGVGNTPNQFEIATSGGKANGPDATIVALNLQTNSTFPTISGGYASGGNVADAISTSGWDANGGYAVAYIGAADTDGAITEGFEITANQTRATANTYVVAGLTGSKVSETVAVGDNVLVDSPLATPIGTVTAISGTTVTVSATLPTGTHAFLIDTLTNKGYVRPAFLTFNGVALTENNVLNGKYQFWEYEHFFTTNSINSAVLPLTNAVVNNLLTQDAQVAGYLISSLTTTNGTLGKSAEGQPINLQ